MPQQLDLTLVERIWSSATLKLQALAEAMPNFVAGLVLLLLTYLVAKLVTRLVRAALGRTSTTGHIDIILGRLAGSALFVAGAMFSLSVMGFQVGALVTSLGLVSVAIGFALKDVLANFMSGVLLLLDRPFAIGDRIILTGDAAGVVKDIRLRDTVLEADDGRLIYVPNQTVFNATIVNDSCAPERRVEVTIAVPASSPLDAVLAAVESGVSSVKGVSPSRPPVALLTKAGADEVEVCGRVWIDVSATTTARATTEAVAAVVERLRQLGIVASEASAAEGTE